MMLPEDQVPLPKPDCSAVALWVGSTVFSQVMAGRIASLLDAPDLKFFPVHQSDVSNQVVTEFRPTVAFSLLTWPGGDALETAARLKQSGFTGSYRAFSHKLPDSSFIEREIRAQVPGLDFSVVELDPETLVWPNA